MTEPENPLASSEPEMGDFLDGLVQLLRPRLIVETGAYFGRGTLALALAARKVGARVVSCEVDRDFFKIATDRISEAEDLLRTVVEDDSPDLPVEIVLGSSLDLPALREADLVFSDSGYRFRREEWLLVKPGAVFVVHDTRVSYDGDLPPHEGWVREAGGVCFETERGFGILVKPRPA